MSHTRIILPVLFLAASLTHAETNALEQVRDPFWPVGYRTVETEELEGAEPEERVRAVTEAEWLAAREAIPRPSGMFVGRHPKTGQPVDKMILLGRTFYPGDPLCLTNAFTAFTWRIDAISFKDTDFTLSRISAERLRSSRE